MRSGQFIPEIIYKGFVIRIFVTEVFLGSAKSGVSWLCFVTRYE